MARKSGIRIVIVVEDSRLDRFCRTALIRLGYDRREIRVEMAPQGKGSAKQWVGIQLPVEVKSIRARADQNLAVLVGSDVDQLEYRQRERQLAEALVAADLAPRGTDERIAWWLPKWSVETWLRYFAGEEVDEGTRCGHNMKSPDFNKVAQAFVAEYRASQSGGTAGSLPALRKAYRETVRIVS